jgi:hypothetical protein
MSVYKASIVWGDGTVHWILVNGGRIRPVIASHLYLYRKHMTKSCDKVGLPSPVLYGWWYMYSWILNNGRIHPVIASQLYMYCHM